MTTVTLESVLDYNAVTSLYLYGVATPPSEIFSRVVAKNAADPVTWQIDAAAFMAGPGRYFYTTLARPNSFITMFFNDVQNGSFSDMPSEIQTRFAAQGNTGVVPISSVVSVASRAL